MHPIIFLMSVRPQRIAPPPSDEFSRNVTAGVFTKVYPSIARPVKIGEKPPTLHMKTYADLPQYLAICEMRETSQPEQLQRQ
jgi:hypothetical protein